MIAGSFKISNLYQAKINNLIPGSDMTKLLLEKYIDKHEIISLVGPSDTDASYISKKYDFQNINSYYPPFGFIDSKNEINKIIKHLELYRPKFIFIALGFPNQEILASIIRSRITFSSTIFCVGASIDFLTGKQQRPFLIFRKLGLEWLGRLLGNPRRLFKRYFFDFFKLVRILFLEIYNSRKKNERKQ